MSGAGRLVLSRHGQTVWHRENRYAGISDIDLTDTGREQGARLADWAAAHRPDTVACSPLRRARETAGPAAQALGVSPLVLPELRELDFGIAEGRTIGELEQDDAGMVERFRADPVAHPFPGAESPLAAADRATAALRELAEAAGDGTVLVVAHNTLLRLALCRLLGIEVRRYRSVFPHMDNGAVTEIALQPGNGGSASLLSFNVPIAAR